ncbi:hypothetical protein ACFL1Z_06080 [Thermodesulfobacteriota bacterium]
MENMFRILQHQNGDNLHIKLIGDFNTNSAWRLLSLLKHNSKYAKRIFIHTACMSEINRVGLHIFHNGLSRQESLMCKITFTGDNVGKLSP